MNKKDFNKLSQVDKLMIKNQETAEEVKEEIKEEVTAPKEEGREEAPKNLKKIKGYVIDPRYYKETKSQRVQSLVRPSTMAEIKKRAKKKKISTNEMVNIIFEYYLENVKE